MGERKVFAKVTAERTRQDARWGGAEHDDALPGGAFVQLITDCAGRARVKARAGRLIQAAALAAAAGDSFGLHGAGRAGATATCEGADREWGSLSVAT